MTARQSWAEIKGGALRPTDPPTWTAATLRSRVSLAVPLVPGEPRQETSKKEAK